MIDVPIREDHGLDRATARASRAAGRENRSRGDLLSQIRGSIEQEPARSIATHGQRRLCPRSKPRLARPHGCTIATIAVPLWKAPPRARSENPDEHSARIGGLQDRCHARRRRRAARRVRISEGFGRPCASRAFTLSTTRPGAYPPSGWSATNLHAASAVGSAAQIAAAPPLHPGWQYGLSLLPSDGQQ